MPQIENGLYRTTHGRASGRVEYEHVQGTSAHFRVLLGGDASGIAADVIITEVECIRLLELMRRARTGVHTKANAA